MSEALAAAGKALLRKITTDTITDREKRSKLLIAFGSVIAALLAAMLLPFAVIYAIFASEPPSFEVNFDEAAFLSRLTPEQQSQLEDMEADVQAIAEAMEAADLQEQTAKAQLIYISCFDGESLTDFTAYAEHFTQDDEQLIQSLNADYGLEINYDEFIRAYTLITKDKGE
jgi:hypothetical protein